MVARPLLQKKLLLQTEIFGFGKGVFWKRGLFGKVHFLENSEIREILENPKTVENKGEADHCLEILENLEILEIPPVKRPLFPALKFINNRTGVWKCLRSLPPDLSPSTR